LCIHAGASLFICAADIGWNLFALKILFKEALENKEKKRTSRTRLGGQLAVRPNQTPHPGPVSPCSRASPLVPFSLSSAQLAAQGVLSLLSLSVWMTSGPRFFSHRQPVPARQLPLFHLPFSCS